MHLFTDLAAESVSAWGELRLIAELHRWLGNATPPSPFGVGDDCAVLPIFKQRPLLTVDPVVYGQHFDDTVSASAVAAKLLKRNLSDIAAMGGRPRAAVIALALEARVSTRWLEHFYRALAATSRRYHVPIVGGDITRQPAGFTATLTLLGEAGGPRVLTRTGAKTGDWLYVTGTLGGSILGHHHRFTPRLAEGAWLARRTDIPALMDLSDGLAKDLHALTPPGATPSLAAGQIPISAAARTLARRDGRSALEHALGDGEDYELLFSLSAKTDPETFERAWRRKFKTRLTRIGRFTRQIEAGALNLQDFHGYEHLR